MNIVHVSDPAIRPYMTRKSRCGSFVIYYCSCIIIILFILWGWGEDFAVCDSLYIYPVGPVWGLTLGSWSCCNGSTVFIANNKGLRIPGHRQENGLFLVAPTDLSICWTLKALKMTKSTRYILQQWELKRRRQLRHSRKGLGRT